MIILQWFSGSLNCTKCSMQWRPVAFFTIFCIYMAKGARKSANSQYLFSVHSYRRVFLAKNKLVLFQFFLSKKQSIYPLVII